MVLFETTVFAKQPHLGIFYACKLSQYTVNILNSPVCGVSVFCLVFILLLVIFCGGLGTLKSVNTAFQFNLFFEGLVNWLLSKCSTQSLQLVLRWLGLRFNRSCFLLFCTHIQHLAKWRQWLQWMFRLLVKQCLWSLDEFLLILNLNQIWLHQHQ